MPIFGITASSNMSAKLTDFYQIATTTLGSATSTVTFSNIPATYTHLQLRSFSQDARGTFGITETRITFNSDSSSLYARHQLIGDGGTVFSDAAINQTYIILGDGTFGTTTGGTFGVGIADILDYANTNKFKTVRQISGVDINGTIASYGGRVGLSSGVWRSTAAISSITLTSNSLINFSANSRFSLYGVKA